MAKSTVLGGNAHVLHSPYGYWSWYSKSNACTETAMCFPTRWTAGPWRIYISAIYWFQTRQQFATLISTNQSPESEYIHGQASQPPWRDHRLVHLQVALDIRLAPALRAPAAVGTCFGKSARGRQSQRQTAKESHIERQKNQHPFLWPTKWICSHQQQHDFCWEPMEKILHHWHTIQPGRSCKC